MKKRRESIIKGDKKKHYCKENDNVILIEMVKDHTDAYYIDQLLFSFCSEAEWVVIGMEDLQDALSKCGYDLARRET